MASELFEMTLLLGKVDSDAGSMLQRAVGGTSVTSGDCRKQQRPWSRDCAAGCTDAVEHQDGMDDKGGGGDAVVAVAVEAAVGKRHLLTAVQLWQLAGED